MTAPTQNKKKPTLLVFTANEASGLFAALGDFNSRLTNSIDTNQFNCLPLRKQILILEGKELQDQIYKKTMNFLLANGLTDVEQIFNTDTQKIKKPRSGI